MRGVDTNIIIRLLVRDDEQQAKKVYTLFKEVEAEKGILFVPLLVVLELIWVLESVYKISRNDMIDSIQDLLAMPILKFENPSILQQFTLSARGSTFDLSDLLIGQSARINDCETTLTFDKKASKSDLFTLVS